MGRDRETDEKRVQPGESLRGQAARPALERRDSREGETDRVGRDAQRRATAYGRARGRL